MQTLFQVRTTEANLDSLLRTLGLLEANLDAGLIDIVQVDNFRQNIETQRANLLTSCVQYDTQVDQFKLQTLGLPPDIPVEVDDTMLRQFEFLDPKTIAVQHLIDDFVRAIGKLPRAPALSDLKSGVELLGKLRERLLRGRVLPEFARSSRERPAGDQRGSYAVPFYGRRQRLEGAPRSTKGPPPRRTPRTVAIRDFGSKCPLA